MNGARPPVDHGKKSRVLVVDDSATVRRFIRTELEAGGYEVSEAEDGKKALMQVSFAPAPDLVTLDIEMPKMDGFETCRQIQTDAYAPSFTREDGRRTPVIFVTGKDTLEDRRKGFELGALVFSSKPFEPGEVRAAVDKILKPETRLQGLTALVVDDNENSLQIVTELLTRMGLNVIRARDGNRAFEILCNRMAEVDLVVSNFNTPGMDGGRLSRKVTQELRLPDLPVIFLIDWEEQSRVLEAFKAGASDYLIKPFVKEEMLARLTVQLERARINKRLRQTIEKLRSLNRMKDRLLAVCSHDLRSPLTGILGFTEALLEKDRWEASTREDLQRIRQSGEFLLSLIDDILDVSKVQADESPLEMEPVSLKQVLETSVNALTYLSAKKRQALSLHLTARHDWVLGNRLALVRAVNNLVSNAIKFTPEGGTIAVTLGAGPPEQLAIEVKDSGIGIAPEKMPRLFDAFTGVSKPGTSGEKGTGLGLSIIRAIAERHGGRVEVQSDPGRGSCFRLLLPWLEEAAPARAAAPPEVPAGGPPAPPAGPQAPPPAARVLVAEDNAVNAMLARRILSKAGHTVTVAEDGRRALEAARREPFDLILLDMLMPEMGGVEAAREIRRTVSGDVPIIALTAHTDPESFEQCIQAGMNDFLSKPFRAEQIHALLRKWLGSRPGQSS